MSQAPSKPLAGVLAGEGGKWPLPKLFLAVGIAGLAIAFVGMVYGLVVHDARPVLSWLLGVSFWSTILLGSLFLVMIFHVFDAGWAVV